MAKYNFDLKLTIEREYIEGPMGFRLLAKKYKIPDRRQIRNWVNSYKAYGEDGLRKKRSKTFYSVQFKMNNPPLIANWHKIFLNEGIERLKAKQKGRPPMSKKRKTKPTKQEKAMSREEQLERENELLRLENAYLKVKSFSGKPECLSRKAQQRWHSNSKKKGSD